MLWVGGQAAWKRPGNSARALPYTAIPAAGVHGVGLRALPGNLLQLCSRHAWLPAASWRSSTPMCCSSPAVTWPSRWPLAGPQHASPAVRPGYRAGPGAQDPGPLCRPSSPSPPKTPRRFFSAPRPRQSSPATPPAPSWTNWDRASRPARTSGLDPQLPVLLVFGGSKGARSINRAVLASLCRSCCRRPRSSTSPAQLDWPEVQAAQAGPRPHSWPPAITPIPYLHEMGAALAAADLAVSRAGASTLGEYPLFGLPAILVPYPYAWRYQKVNADYLVEPRRRADAGRCPPGRDLLSSTPSKTCSADPTGCSEMRQAMQSLARPGGARRSLPRLRTGSCGSARKGGGKHDRSDCHFLDVRHPVCHHWSSCAAGPRAAGHLQP